MWARVVNTILGIWMMVVPSVLRYEKVAANNAYIFGCVIATIAIIAMAESVRNVRWLNLFMGLWLVVAPWILTFENSTNILNDTIVGLLVAGLSFVKGRIKEKMDGGWIKIIKS